jgi:gluconokinase
MLRPMTVSKKTMDGTEERKDMDQTNDNNLMLVLMGVCGCGKNTIGELLRDEMQWPFYDGDDYHPPANVEKMRRGEPLNDEDRYPWLEILAQQATGWLEQGDSLLASSALKQRYRDIIRAQRPQVRFVYLKGSYELISARLAARQHRYMPATLLDSQFEALEEPQDAWIIDIAGTPEDAVAQIRRHVEAGR